MPKLGAMPTSRTDADPAAAEDIAHRIAAVAADLDAVAHRAALAVAMVEALGGSPNKVLAVRRAAQAAASAAHELRGEGLLNDRQQKLL